MCESWRKFENFLADMGQRPPNMSLERINNEADYEPSNCRWATRSEQARNKRNNHMLTIDGEAHCITAWSEISGVRARTIRSRLAAGRSPFLAVFGDRRGRVRDVPHDQLQRPVFLPGET